MPYSPHEQKRSPIQGFPGVSDITEKEKEPDSGAFSFTYDPAGILFGEEKFIPGWIIRIDDSLIFD